MKGKKTITTITTILHNIYFKIIAHGLKMVFKAIVYSWIKANHENLDLQ